MQVRRFQAFAQLLLRLRHQHPKAGVAGGEEVRQVIRRIPGRSCAGSGASARGPVDESQLLQSRLRRMAQLAPFQSTLQLLRRDTTVRPQQAQIQQRRIPSPRPMRLVRLLGREHDTRLILPEIYPATALRPLSFVLYSTRKPRLRKASRRDF